MPKAKEPKGLPVPDRARASSDENAKELLRLWFVDGRPESTLWPAFDNPEWFGVVLSDTVRNLARVYAAAGIAEEQVAFQAITSGLMQGLASPQYTPGEIRPLEPPIAMGEI